MGLRHRGFGLDRLFQRVAHRPGPTGGLGPAVERPRHVPPTEFAESLICRRVFLVLAVTIVLVLGIRESVRTNATLVAAKLVVVGFVVVAGWAVREFVALDQDPGFAAASAAGKAIPDLVRDYLDANGQFSEERAARLEKALMASRRMAWRSRKCGSFSSRALTAAEVAERAAELAADLPASAADRQAVEQLTPKVAEKGKEAVTASGACSDCRA